MDVSTIQCSVQQVWTVNEDGSGKELSSQIVSYGCVPCGVGLGGSWETAATHCREFHSPEGRAAANGGVPSDGTSVSTFHAVALETPDE